MSSSETDATFELDCDLEFVDDSDNVHAVFDGSYSKLSHDKERLQVAVKRLAANRIGKPTKDDIQQLLRINHDNLVHYYHIGVRHNTWYLSMNECHWNLPDYLNEFDDVDSEELSRLEINDLLWQVCCGLEYLHNQIMPIVHSNLKPTNVLLSWDDERNKTLVKLADYGLNFPSYAEKDYEKILGISSAKDVHDLGEIFKFACSCSADDIVGSEATLDRLPEEQHFLAKELVALMTDSTDFLQRPSITLVMCHPFFTRFLPEAHSHLVKEFGPHYIAEHAYFGAVNVNHWIGLQSEGYNKDYKSFMVGYVKRWLDKPTDDVGAIDESKGRIEGFVKIFENIYLENYLAEEATIISKFQRVAALAQEQYPKTFTRLIWDIMLCKTYLENYPQVLVPPNGVVLGQGGNGFIRKVWRRVKHDVVHVVQKTFNDSDFAVKEHSALLRLSHWSVIKMINFDLRNKFMLIELCEGDVGHYVKGELSRLPYKPENNKLIFAQMAIALAHIHRANVLHKDLKPQNVLLKWTGVPGFDCLVKLADFGLGKTLAPGQHEFEYTGTRGTAGYMAPELLVAQVGEPLMATQASDVFALGVTAFFLFSKGDHPHGNEKDWQVTLVKNGVAVALIRNEAVAMQLDLFDLISSLLSHDAEKRPRSSLVVHHPYFSTTNERTWSVFFRATRCMDAGLTGCGIPPEAWHRRLQSREIAVQVMSEMLQCQSGSKEVEYHVTKKDNVQNKLEEKAVNFRHEVDQISERLNNKLLVDMKTTDSYSDKLRKLQRYWTGGPISTAYLMWETFLSYKTATPQWIAERLQIRTWELMLLLCPQDVSIEVFRSGALQLTRAEEMWLLFEAIDHGLDKMVSVLINPGECWLSRLPPHQAPPVNVGFDDPFGLDAFLAAGQVPDAIHAAQLDTSRYEMSLLCYAARVAPNVATVEALLKRSIRLITEEDPRRSSWEFMSSCKRTALHYASSNTSCVANKLQLVELLLKTGRVHANQLDDKGKLALHYAATFSDAETVRLLTSLTETPHCVTFDRKTALHCAAKHRDGSTAEETFRFLLGDGRFDVDAVDRFGATTIQYAAGTSSAGAVALLLNSGAKHDGIDESGKTLLHHAATNQRDDADEVIKLFLQRGLDVATFDASGRLALHYAAEHSTSKAVELLLPADADLRRSKDIKGRTPLHCAFLNERHSCDVVKLLLLKGNADTEARDAGGLTALHRAVTCPGRRYTAAIKHLIDAKCNVNACSLKGRTALHLAAAESKTDAERIRLLLDSGANANMADKKGHVPLHVAAKGSSLPVFELLYDATTSVNRLTPDKKGRTLLHLVFGKHHRKPRYSRPGYGHSHLELARFLLSKGGINVDDRDANEQTALHTAVQLPTAADGAKLLLSHGAEPNIGNKDGKVPLHVAVETLESVEVVKLLLEGVPIRHRSGPTSNSKTAEPDSRDSSGATALHLAIGDGNWIMNPMNCMEITQLLLDYDANADLVDGDGRLPLHLAAQTELPDLVKKIFLYTENRSLECCNGKTAVDYSREQLSDDALCDSEFASEPAIQIYKFLLESETELKQIPYEAAEGDM